MIGGIITANTPSKYHPAEEINYCEGITFSVRKYTSNKTGIYHAEVLYKNPAFDISYTAKTSGHTEEERDANVTNKAIPNLLDKIRTQLPNINDPSSSSFKSLWLIYKEPILKESGWSKRTSLQYSKLIEKYFVPQFGNADIKTLATLQVTSVIESVAKELDYNVEQAEKLYEILDKVLSYLALNKKYLEKNPLEEYMSLKACKKSCESAIKDHFKPGRLDLRTQALILKKAIDNISSGGQYLGVAIIQFASLTCPEACGLNYGNIHKYENGTSLFISRQYELIKGQKKASMAPLRSPYNYRSVPVASVLETLIDARRKILKTAGFSSIEINKMPLVCLNNQMKRRMTPEKLKKFAVQLLIEVGQEERIIEEPSNNRIKIPVEVGIFKSTYQFMSQEAGMDKDEINYLSGNALIDTVSKHYIDWLNNYVQLELRNKTNLWVEKVQKEMEVLDK